MPTLCSRIRDQKRRFVTMPIPARAVVRAVRPCFDAARLPGLLRARPLQMLAILCLAAIALAPAPALAQQDQPHSPHAGMLRYPDVSKSHIVFVYANDLWVVPRDGGTALPLASPPGEEQFPRFSDDGQTIAFVGNYEGGRDIYTIPVSGGVPHRVTHHPGGKTLNGWTPDGRLLYSTNAFAGRDRITELFTVSPDGETGAGVPQKLPVPYGAIADISPDGQWLAYTFHTRDFRTWKRYRGGMATNIWLFNLNNHTARQMTDWEGTDTQPMWHGNTVYYLSDAGPAHRLNIWKYNVDTRRREQVTRFREFDVKWPSMGPGPNGNGEIVFQHGADLYLLDLGTNAMRTVNVTVPGDRTHIRPQPVDVSSFISNADISPSGARVTVEARGDVWTLPAEHGSPRNLTRTSGVAERTPAWSPDARWIAYMSDETGEYEMYVTQSDGRGETKQLTEGSEIFYYEPIWSPDSKHIAFTDKAGWIYLHTIESGETKQVVKDPFSWDNTSRTVDWSHDSRWLTFALSGERTPSSSVYLYNVEEDELHQVTHEMFNDSSPVFDRKGDYLYFTSNRSFSPMYGELDTSFIYARTQVLMAVPLREDMKHPWLPESDEETWKDEDEEDENGDEENGENGENGDDAANDEPDAEPVPDDGISGVWSGTVSGPQPLPPGGAPFSLTLNVASDGAVSGSLNVMEFSGAITGQYNRASGALTFTMNIEGVELQFNGNARDGSLTGTGAVPAMGMTVEFKGERTQAAGAGDRDGADAKADDKARETVEIDIEGFESRAIILPVSNGNFGRLGVNDRNQLIYARGAHRGESGGWSIKLFDITDDQKREQDVAAGAGLFRISADGKKMLIVRGSSLSIQNAAAGASAKPVVTAGMTVRIDPREEWRQVFHDAWRIQRDFFYDAGLHGVDWEAMRDRYEPMLESCASREDVGFVIAEMISELNVGHAYYRVGRTGEPQPSVSVGLLGCEFEVDNGAFRISKIHEGAQWDADARGPLSAMGVDVNVGDYLLAVNGMPLDGMPDPWAAFAGTVGRAVTITVSEKPELDDDARDVVIQPIGSDYGLRYRAWIEKNRAYVEEQTDGRVGYIYVPSTGVDGQNDLVRQFYGQRHKEALIIDERWNSGGQIPTRFIELLNRPATNYWARRDGNDWMWPPDSHQGPKAMLINGLAGSGGDAFPAYFRQAGLGKLIGTRTWGGLVGIHGNPALIDGSSITVPTFGFYTTDGKWSIEGHGVDPDIEVIDDPSKMVDGGDPQLDAAIEHILEELERNPHVPPQRPRSPDRSGMGLPMDER
ncbi:MAG: peptidase S41 [Phycisphaeraceae bacterium]|nr:MAG: peptidase S41 [Phycisphaeraceae bacterium]